MDVNDPRHRQHGQNQKWDQIQYSDDYCDWHLLEITNSENGCKGPGAFPEDIVSGSSFLKRYNTKHIYRERCRSKRSRRPKTYRERIADRWDPDDQNHVERDVNGGRIIGSHSFLQRNKDASQNDFSCKSSRYQPPRTRRRFNLGGDAKVEAFRASSPRNRCCYSTVALSTTRQCSLTPTKTRPMMIPFYLNTIYKLTLLNSSTTTHPSFFFLCFFIRYFSLFQFWFNSLTVKLPDDR